MKHFLIIAFFFIASTLFATECGDVPDPFRWLEDDATPETKFWLNEQKTQSESYFAKDPLRDYLTRLLTHFSDYETIETPRRFDNNYFFMSRQRGNSQTCLYKMNLVKEITMLVDPTQFSDDGTTSLTTYSLSPDGKYLAYGISHTGSDWEHWHIKNLDSGEDPEEIVQGIKFTPTIGPPIWDANGEGFFYFFFDLSDSEASFSSQQSLRYHRVGTSPSCDREIFNNKEDGMFYYGSFLAEDGRYLLCSRTQGFSDCNGIISIDLLNDSLEIKEWIPLTQASYKYCGSKKDRFYFITNQDAPNGKIISLLLHSPFEEAIEHIPESQNAIENAFLMENKIVVSYLEDVRSILKIFDMNGHLCQQIRPSSYRTIGNVRSLSSKENPSGPEIIYQYLDFLSPSIIYKADLNSGLEEVFIGQNKSWDSEKYQVTQIFYPSQEGVRIPMFIIHKKGIVLDGSHPTLLYGYGGFNISLPPSFNPKVLAWIELGGIYAVANIRGGGEYGEAWHQAGRLHNKQNVFDDFIAAGEWLCANGYTNASKLAIYGRSNGGLLVAACMIQKPELFKAALVSVGVLDMLRFHLFTVGWTWTAEYGSPENKQDCRHLFAYSPYHQIKKGISYPATLITTSDHDNRVVPLHSYKFAANLQANQKGTHPVLLKVYQNTGHGSGRSRNQIIEEDADQLYFLIKELELDMQGVRYASFSI